MVAGTEQAGQSNAKSFDPRTIDFNDTRIVGFNASKVDSSDALKAYEVFARQTDGLLAILVFQYDAYEAGAGKTFWVKDRNGIEVPVISARYSIWNHLNHRPRAGTPAKVARQRARRQPRGTGLAHPHETRSLSNQKADKPISVI